VRNQLAKIVYFTSKDRIISCYYNRVRYSTERKTFTAPKGEYIQLVKQYKDTRRCCGRVTEVVTEKFVKSINDALDEAFAKTCSATQYLVSKGESR
jgi:hypothetical protein